MILNMMPAYQSSVGAPRVAAISHPFGRPFGDVDNAEGQRKVLRSALQVLVQTQVAGAITHLSFRWPQEPKKTKWEPNEPSPIVAMMLKARG